MKRRIALVLAFILALSPLPVSPAAAFADVADTAWYADAVIWCAEAGIVTGRSDSSFAPQVRANRKKNVKEGAMPLL